MAELEQVGIDFLIDINLGDEVTPNFQPAGGQRGGTLRRTSEVIDLKHKTSGAWPRKRVSFLDWGISGDSIFILDDATKAALEAAWENRQEIGVRWREPNGDIHSGSAVIGDLSQNAPHDGPATFAIDLQGNSTLTRGSINS